MYPIKEYHKVLAVLFGVLCVSEGASNSLPCVEFEEDPHMVTFNCSRRNIDAIPEKWPAKSEKDYAAKNLLITFFNNSLTKIERVPAVNGTRVALSFKMNKISSIEYDAFSNIGHLVYLDLSNNSITGEILREEIFRGPYENGVYDNIDLETLNLGSNQVHSIDRNLFKYTPNITRLYLNNNPLVTLDMVTLMAIARAVHLEVLDLSYTGIDNVPLDAFKSLYNLRQLDLSGNQLMMIPESLRFVGATLEFLNFNNNNVVELNDDSFVGLENLKELEVGENKYLEEVKRSTFTPLVSLKRLHLCHNRNLRYISHNAFRGMRDNWTIEEVYLDDNNLSELPTDLLPWNKLHMLSMTGNNWLCNCDLVNIVITQKAGEKFVDEIPRCVAPMKWSGLKITEVNDEFCASIDPSIVMKKKFSMNNLKPKHVLWSIVGVSAIVSIGMILGLCVNKVKKVYKIHVRNPQIPYVNIKEDNVFA